MLERAYFTFVAKKQRCENNVVFLKISVAYGVPLTYKYTREFYLTNSNKKNIYIFIIQK